MRLPAWQFCDILTLCQSLTAALDYCLLAKPLGCSSYHTIHHCPTLSISTLWMPNAKFWVRVCIMLPLCWCKSDATKRRERRHRVLRLENIWRTDGENPVPLWQKDCFWEVNSAQIGDAIIINKLLYCAIVIHERSYTRCCTNREISVPGNPTYYVICLDKNPKWCFHLFLRIFFIWTDSFQKNSVL